jgi:thymidylate synthase ThyX
MGHKSVGNHANFNFDIMGLSRLGVEWLEARRIGVGYTEKSQRYITLRGDYVIPSELSPEDADKLRDLIENTQNPFYTRNFETLVKYHFDGLGVPYVDEQERVRLKKQNLETIEGYGKEDARYGIGLATQAQIGTTMSATALEHAIRTKKYSPIAEVRELAQKLFDAVKDIAPSLILYTDPDIFQKSFPGAVLRDDNFRDAPRHIREAVDKTFGELEGVVCQNSASFRTAGDVTMVHCSSPDMNVMAALLLANSGKPLEECYRIASYLRVVRPDAGLDFMREVWRYVTEFDNPPREFEFGGDFKFGMDISATCFAQLKRHRIMTWIPQRYDPELGITVPVSIRDTGLEPELRQVCAKSSALFYGFKQRYGQDIAEYCLANAQRRRVLVAINARELNHFARQRSDSHAQWDIRNISHQMVQLAGEVAPLSLLLTCGKDEYSALRAKVYGDQPEPDNVVPLKNAAE